MNDDLTKQQLEEMWELDMQTKYKPGKWAQDEHEEEAKLVRMALAVWAFAALIGLGFIGLVAWGIIKLVQYVTQ